MPLGPADMSGPWIFDGVPVEDSFTQRNCSVLTGGVTLVFMPHLNLFC